MYSCGEKCDCHYCGQEELNGADAFCTMCDKCEKEIIGEIPEAPDYGTTTDY
ncbi:MAG: hypothetical protein M5U17_01755 [Ignavibacterium sp.]|nr:hypothetical protein [Ignavibacterium sp.]